MARSRSLHLAAWLNSSREPFGAAAAAEEFVGEVSGATAVAGGSCRRRQRPHGASKERRKELQRALKERRFDLLSQRCLAPCKRKRCPAGLSGANSALSTLSCGAQVRLLLASKLNEGSSNSPDRTGEAKP